MQWTVQKKKKAVTAVPCVCIGIALRCSDKLWHDIARVLVLTNCCSLHRNWFASTAMNLTIH